VSTDGGATWNTGALAATPHSATEARILAVDPNDPGTVYIRMVGAGKTQTISDAIVVTTGSGASSVDVLDLDASLTSFLFARDGTLYAGTATGQLYVKAPTDSAFQPPRAAPHLRCLAQRPGSDTIYACADMVVDGYSLGVSNDKGVTFQKVMSFRDLAGPLSCGPVQSSCAAHWSRMQGVLFGSDAGVVLPDGGTQPPPPPPTPGGSNCASTGAGASALLLLLAFALRKARRPQAGSSAAASLNKSG
jgi:hypothetical protein